MAWEGPWQPAASTFPSQPRRVAVTITTEQLHWRFCAPSERHDWAFPGSPAVKTLRFHCRRDPGSIPGRDSCRVLLLKNRKQKQTKQATRLVTGGITWAQSVCGQLAPRLPPHTHGEPTLPFSPTNIEFFHLHCDGETEAEFAKCDSFSSAFSFLRKFQTHAFPAHTHFLFSFSPHWVAFQYMSLRDAP